jgi:ABC-type nitrate/sulfonate/bicarbonate transport system permease component
MTTIDPYGRAVDETRRWRYQLLPAIAWICVLFLYVVVVPQVVSPLRFPGPLLVAGAVQHIGPNLVLDALSTLQLVLAGFVSGTFLGMLVGFLMFALPAVDSLLFSLIEFARPVPPIALIPFFILWFGLNPAAQIGLVALGCFMVMVISTREALSKVSVDTRRAARSLGASGYTYYVEVLLRAILPTLTGSLRVSLALAFALAVAAEFMGAQSGLGYLMMIARRTLQTETILLGVIILGLESAIMDWLLRTLMKRLTRWHS